MTVYALGDQVPSIDPEAWVHPQAVVIGSVTLGAEVSIWPCAVLRGDFGPITIGVRTSIQDGTVVHANTVVGRNCIVGHNAYIEGCTIEDEAMVGSEATVLPRARVGRGAVIAAGAVVVRGADVAPHALARGVPAVIELDAIEDGRWAAGVQRYVDLAKRYRTEMREVSADGDDS
jgi:carbonic anhydrase/acetyltransferase-like protein (isoleucine patch superfamily)